MVNFVILTSDIVVLSVICPINISVQAPCSGLMGKYSRFANESYVGWHFARRIRVASETIYEQQTLENENTEETEL